MHFFHSLEGFAFPLFVESLQNENLTEIKLAVSVGQVISLSRFSTSSVHEVYLRLSVHLLAYLESE